MHPNLTVSCSSLLSACLCCLPASVRLIVLHYISGVAFLSVRQRLDISLLGRIWGRGLIFPFKEFWKPYMQNVHLPAFQPEGKGTNSWTLFMWFLLLLLKINPANLKPAMACCHCRTSSESAPRGHCLTPVLGDFPANHLYSH